MIKSIFTFIILFSISLPAIAAVTEVPVGSSSSSSSTGNGSTNPRGER